MLWRGGFGSVVGEGEEKGEEVSEPRVDRAVAVSPGSRAGGTLAHGTLHGHVARLRCATGASMAAWPRLASPRLASPRLALSRMVCVSLGGVAWWHALLRCWSWAWEGGNETHIVVEQNHFVCQHSAQLRSGLTKPSEEARRKGP